RREVFWSAPPLMRKRPHLTYRRRFGFLKTIEKDLLMSDLPLLFIIKPNKLQIQSAADMSHADVFAGGRRTPNTPARGFLECAARWFQHSPETYRRRFGFLRTIEKDLPMSDLPLFSSSSNLTNYRSKAPPICRMRTFSQEAAH